MVRQQVEQGKLAAKKTRADTLVPTLAFLLNVITGIKAASQTSNCGAMRFGFLKNDNALAANNDE